MTKYEIMTDNFELRLGAANRVREMSADEVLCEYQDQTANAPTLVESYDSLDEARAAFRTYANYGSTRLERGVTGCLLVGQLALLVENEYDEDGNFDQGGNVIDSAVGPYRKLYSVTWVGGNRDGEVLANFGAEQDAIRFAQAFQAEHEDEFDAVCGGVSIEDDLGNTVENW